MKSARPPQARRQSSIVGGSEHGAGDVFALEAARRELTVGRSSEVLVAQRHGACLVNAGEEFGRVGEEPVEQTGSGAEQGGKASMVISWCLWERHRAFHIHWYTIESTDAYRIAAILACMPDVELLAADRRLYAGHIAQVRRVLPPASLTEVVHEKLEATPGIEPGYTVLQTVA